MRGPRPQGHSPAVSRSVETSLRFSTTSGWSNDTCSISKTSASWHLVCGPSKQQQIPVRVFDDEILGAPRLPFQCLVKCNTSGLKLKKQ